MNMRQLLEKRAKLVTQLREMQDAADTTSGGNMTEEQQAAFETVKAALADLETAMSRRALVEEAERRMSGAPLGGTGDRHLDRALSDFSVVRAIAAAAGLGVDASREREISQEIARRSGRKFEGVAVPIQALRRPVERRDVITTTTPAAGPGGNLVATLLDGSQYIDLLREALVIRGLGARVLTDLSSNVDVPRMTKSAKTGWVAENTPLPYTDEQFDKVALRPKHAGAIVELSRNMLQQTTPDIEQLVRADLAAVLARALDSAAIAGAGGVEPVGILNTPGVAKLSIDTNGGALTYDLVADLIASVENQNAAGDNMGFLTNTSVKRSATKAKDTMNRPLGLDVFFQGYPQAYTNLVTSAGSKGTGRNLSSLIFGNWSDLLIGMWSELDILVNPFAQSAYEKGNVLVRAMMTCDIAVRHPESFAALTDIDASKSSLPVAA